MGSPISPQLVRSPQVRFFKWRTYEVVGWADSFVYYIKNSVEGGQIFRLLHEKQQAGWTNFQKTINGHIRSFKKRSYKKHW